MNILFVNNDMVGNGGSLSLINMYKSLNTVNGKKYFAILGSRINHQITSQIEIIFKCFNGTWVVPFKSLKQKICSFARIFLQLIRNIYVVCSLCHLIKVYHIDIVHTNTSWIIAGLVAAKICGVKHVWHLREYIYENQGYYPILGFRFLRYLISKSDVVIPISRGIKTFFNTDFNFCYDAVFSLKEILPEKDKKGNYILFCGSLNEGKQPLLALRAFSNICREYPYLRLVFAGTGNLENSLKEQAKNLNLTSKVDFLGYVAKPYFLFNNAKAFLMTSKAEGMGRTTIEAMANDCVVIGYNNGGTAEIIKHNITGFLFDTEKELVDYLKFVLNSKDNCKTIRISAKKWAIENSSEEVYGEKIKSVYYKLLGGIK